MASGAKNQLPLVNDLGAPTLRDGSVGRWDGKESFFPERAAGFARRRVPIEVSQKNAFMEGWERAELHMIRRPCWYNDKP